MNELVWERGILEFRRSLIVARANKTLVPSNAITVPIYYVLIYSKTIFITIPSTLSWPSNTRYSCINSSRHFFSSLSFLRLTFEILSMSYLPNLLQSNYNPKIFQFIHIRAYSIDRNLFPNWYFRETFPPRQTKIHSKIILFISCCINVKPLCQTSIGERCRYEMVAFKAGEFVETTARPFRGIYIYIYI